MENRRNPRNFEEEARCRRPWSECEIVSENARLLMGVEVDFRIEKEMPANAPQRIHTQVRYQAE